MIRDTIVEQGGTWELRVQPNTDLDKIPIEDVSIDWDEEASPYRAVGRIGPDDRPLVLLLHG